MSKLVPRIWNKGFLKLLVITKVVVRYNCHRQTVLTYHSIDEQLRCTFTTDRPQHPCGHANILADLSKVHTYRRPEASWNRQDSQQPCRLKFQPVDTIHTYSYMCSPSCKAWASNIVAICISTTQKTT